MEGSRLCSSSVILQTVLLLPSQVSFQMAKFLPNEERDGAVWEEALHLKTQVSSSNILWNLVPRPTPHFQLLSLRLQAQSTSLWRES